MPRANPEEEPGQNKSRQERHKYEANPRTGVRRQKRGRAEGKQQESSIDKKMGARGVVQYPKAEFQRHHLDNSPSLFCVCSF